MRILRLKAVIQKTGLARSTITRLIADQAFPPPLQLSRKSVGWVESDVNDWLLEKVSDRDNLDGKASLGEPDSSSHNQDITILRLNQVIRITSLARSTIYQLMSAGLFPKAVLLSERAVGWVESEVSLWLHSLGNDCLHHSRVLEHSMIEEG